MEEYYTLTETSSNFNEVICQTFQSLNRSKLLSFEVSQKFAVFGASSGGIYVFYRSPCQFLKLLPTKEGAVELLVISPNEKYLAVATSKGVVIVFDECFREDKKIKFQIYSEHQGCPIKCLRWHDYNLFAGDNEGKVSVTTFSSTLLTKAIFQPAMFVILRLDSSIFQLDSYTHYLLVSTKTRTYLCDTENETFKQIGKKLRDGDYGACFFNIVSSVENDSKENETKSTSGVMHEVEIYCARPGVRLWQANFEPAVIFTHQFKEGLHKQRSEIILLDDNPHSKLKFVKFDSDESVQNFNFGKLLVVCDRFILTFNSNGFYIFDPLETRLSFWCSYNNIKDIKIVGSLIHIWRNSKVNVISLSKIEDLVLHTLVKRQYYLCTELCLKFSSTIIKNIENYKKIHLTGILSEKLAVTDNALLEKIAPFLDQVKSNSIKYFGDQNLQKDVEVSLNSSNEKLYETSFLTENIWHLKSVSLVTEKINKSTKNIKEKFQKFETAVKNFAIDSIKDNNETDVLDECGINIADREDSVFDQSNPNSDKDIVILYREDSDSSVSTSSSTNATTSVTASTEIANEIKDVNESTEKNNNSLLFYQYKMTEVNQNYMIPKFEQFMSSSDFGDIKNVFIKFSLYMEDQGYENVNKWCQEQYLKFISKSKNYNFEALPDDTREYLIEGFYEVNATPLRNSCNCGYPVPGDKNTIPRFYEIGKKLIVSSGDLYKASLCIPYMWKDYLKSLSCLELGKHLNLIIQYNDLNLLEKFSRLLYFDYWDEIVKLNIKLNKKLCLNCNCEIDINGLVNWTDLGLQILKSLGGLNTLQLLKNYADYLPKRDLDPEFYQACIFSMSTADYNTDINKHWNLFIKLQRKEDTKQEVTNALELFLNKSYLGGPKEDSFMIPAINCSFCDIPINTPILDKFLKLDCGHMYHTLCFNYLNNNCRFC